MLTDLPATVDPESQYQELFDTLGEAFWDASNGAAKEQIQKARDATHKILTGIHRQKLEANTEEFLALTEKVKALEPALRAIQAEVEKIVSNIALAGRLQSAVAGVLSLAGKV